MLFILLHNYISITNVGHFNSWVDHEWVKWLFGNYMDRSSVTNHHIKPGYESTFLDPVLSRREKWMPGPQGPGSITWKLNSILSGILIAREEPTEEDCYSHPLASVHTHSCTDKENTMPT